VEPEDKDFFEETYTLLTNYVDDRLLLLKIRAAEKSGKLAAIIVKLAVTLFFIFFIFLFVSIMGGYYFSEITGSQFYGFGIIAGIYVFLFLMFLLFRKQISRQVMNTVIHVFFERSAGEINSNDDYDE
jgi:hypothetical protein